MKLAEYEILLRQRRSNVSFIDLINQKDLNEAKSAHPFVLGPDIAYGTDFPARRAEVIEQPCKAPHAEAIPGLREPMTREPLTNDAATIDNVPLDIKAKVVQSNSGVQRVASPLLPVNFGSRGSTANSAAGPVDDKHEAVLPKGNSFADEVSRATVRRLRYVGAGIFGCFTLMAVAPLLSAVVPMATSAVVAATALAAMIGRITDDAQALLDLDAFLTKPGSRAAYQDWLRREPTENLMKVCLSQTQIENLNYVSRDKFTWNDCPFIRPNLRRFLLDVLANEPNAKHLASDIAWLQAEIFGNLGSSHSVTDYRDMIAFGRSALATRRNDRA